MSRLQLNVHTAEVVVDGIWRISICRSGHFLDRTVLM